MITEVGIENFRTLERIQINDLKQFTLISGKPRCGKTSILEAINTAIGTKNAFDSKFYADNVPYTSIFWNNDKPFRINIVNTPDTVSTTPTKTSLHMHLGTFGDPHLDDELDSYGPYPNTKTDWTPCCYFAHGPKIDEQYLIPFIRNNRPKIGCLREDVAPRAIYISKAYQTGFSTTDDPVSNYDKAYANHSNLHRTLAGHLNYILFHHIRECLYTSVRTVFLPHEGGVFLACDTMDDEIDLIRGGESIYKILACLTAMYADNDAKIVLIDDIETDMAPQYYSGLWKKLVEIATERNLQIIATTQDQKMIKTVANDMLSMKLYNKLTYFQIGYDRYGEHQAQCYYGEMLAHALAHNVEVQ